jgi:signal peptidase I
MWRTTKDLLIVLFLTILFATGLKSCIVDAYKIPSASMVPTLQEGDFLLVNKFIYGARTPQSFFFFPLPVIQFPALHNVQRGDIIVFEFPGEPNETIIVRNLFLVKRCVGLPGDTISIAGGRVAVNGEPMEFFPDVAKDMHPLFVPKKGMMVNVNAQNFFQWKNFIRREGADVDLKEGKVHVDGNEISIYPIRRNYYFVLGDNINNSSDSRNWGFVPEEHIAGKAMMLYWSKGSDGVRWERIGTIVK